MLSVYDRHVIVECSQRDRHVVGAWSMKIRHVFGSSQQVIAERSLRDRDMVDEETASEG